MSGPQSQGQFAYRLTDRSGSSSGAFDVWWDARSDWNADNEKAAYCGAMRTLDDLLPIAGFSAGAGAGFGFDGRGYVIHNLTGQPLFGTVSGTISPSISIM